MEENEDKNKEKISTTQYKKNSNENIDYYSDVKTNNKTDDKSKKYHIMDNILNDLNDIPLEQLEEILLDINDDKYSQSIQNLLLDKEFVSPVVIKKENKLITDFHYVTFKNAYGENSCFVNVILHLLYYIPELDEFLISLYEIDESNRDGKDKDMNSNDEKNKFLVLLGKILYQYENIINEENDEENRKKNVKMKKNQITVVKTLNMRKYLANISKNKFPLNTVADPVELFNFILDILNENLGEDLHKSFYLELIDEFNCKSQNKCEITIKNKYDKDNFIYHIYIDEILKYIEQKNIKVKNYKNKLFELSYKLFLSENTKKCEKCKEEMEHNLVCTNSPEFLLINCVWKESNPIVDDVISLFFLMSLKDELNSLFICYNKRPRKKNNYYLLGFILYSFTMSHYIICVYNYDKKVFVLLDDETVKEYNNLYELILDITVNILKTNDKGFFYPVMLIFTQETLYDYKTIKFNTLNDSEYSLLINKCNEAIYECQTQNTMNEEEKLNNYKEYIDKQKEIENKILNKRNKKEDNINDNKEEKQKTKNDINDNKKDDKNNKNYEENNSDEEYIKEKKDKKIKNERNDDNSMNGEDSGNKKQENKSTLKIGLNQINQNKISQILKDINKIKRSNNKNDLYVGNFRDLDKIQNKYLGKSKLAKEEKERKDEEEQNKAKENEEKEEKSEVKKTKEESEEKEEQKKEEEKERENEEENEEEKEREKERKNEEEKERENEEEKERENEEEKERENEEEKEKENEEEKEKENKEKESQTIEENQKEQKQAKETVKNGEETEEKDKEEKRKYLKPVNNYIRKNKNYMNQKVDDNKEDKDKEKEKNKVYKKRIGIAENTNYYHHNIKSNKRNENIINKPTPDYNTENDKDNITSIVTNDGNRRKRKFANQSNIVWNNKVKIEPENENDKNKEKAYIYNDNKAKNNSYMTPKKERFHYSKLNKNEDNDGSNNKSSNEKDDNQNSYKSEKKDNLYKSHFMENKISKNIKEDINKDNNNKNDINIIQQNIRKKYYIRKNKE